MAKLKNIKNPVISASYHNMTSDFGYRIHPITKKKKMHNGIDLTPSSNIIAIEEGKVTAVRDSIKGYSETYSSGNYVTIYHGNNTYTVYYHMKLNSIKVKKGDKVKKGQVIGKMGSTGASTGTHLHFGVKINSKWQDPKPYLYGTKDIIPKPTPKPEPTKEYYVVKGGDTLSKIAKKYNTTWQKLYEMNKSTIDKVAKEHGKKKNFYNYLYAGTKLRVK